MAEAKVKKRPVLDAIKKGLQELAEIAGVRKGEKSTVGAENYSNAPWTTRDKITVVQTNKGNYQMVKNVGGRYLDIESETKNPINIDWSRAKEISKYDFDYMTTKRGVVTESPEIGLHKVYKKPKSMR